MPLCERSLKIREKTFGPDHPDVATSLNNLVSLLRNQVGCFWEHPIDAGIIAQGKYDDAIPLNERALRIYEKTLGPDHPAVAKSINNHAVLLEEQVGS